MAENASHDSTLVRRAPPGRLALALCIGAFSVAMLACPAPVCAQSAAQFTIDGAEWTLVAGEARGEWQLRGPAGGERTLTVPAQWDVDASGWQAERATLDGGAIATMLLQEDAGVRRGFAFVGGGELVEDTLVWTGVQGPVHSDRYAALVGDSSGHIDLVLHLKDPRVPDCGGLTARLGVAYYDTKRASFVERVSAPNVEPIEVSSLPAETSPAADVPSVDAERISAALNWRALTLPAARRARGEMVANPAALWDARAETDAVIEPGGTTAVLQLHPALTAEGLVAVPADESSARALADGALIVETGDEEAFSPRLREGDAGAGAAGIVLPLGEEVSCVVVRASEPLTLSHVGLRAKQDANGVDAAIETLIQRGLDTEDRGEALAVASALARVQQRALPLLRTAIEDADDTATLARLGTLTRDYSDVSAARLALEFAVHPMADRPIVESAFETLEDFPEHAASALRERITENDLEPGSAAHLRVARLLARLPVRGAVGPLLQEVVASADDDERREVVLDAVAEVGPRLAGIIPIYLTREELGDAPRIDMLRALLRVAPAWRALETDLSERAVENLVAMLDREPLAVRLLGVRIAGAYHIEAAATRLVQLARQSDVDIERAQAVSALAAADPGQIEVLTSSLEDSSPTVRIAAAEALARPDVDVGSDLAEMLPHYLDTETWPEALAPAMRVLYRVDPDAAMKRAYAWLRDDEIPSAQRSAAGHLVAAHGDFTWSELRGWLDDEALSRSVRHALLDAYASRPDADAALLMEAAAERIPLDDDVHWRDGFIETVLIALQMNHPTLLDSWLPDLYAQLSPGDPVALLVVELMGFHDTPEIRKMLDAASRADNAKLAEQARQSLRRLDGESILDPEAPDDLSGIEF